MNDSCNKLLEAARSASFDGERYRTIVILVHGVGDHKGSSLLGEAERGFSEYASKKLAGTSGTLWSYKRDADALIVCADGDHHLITPYLWSRTNRITHADLFDGSASTSIGLVNAAFHTLERAPLARSGLLFLACMILVELLCPIWVAIYAGIIVALPLFAALFYNNLHGVYFDTKLVWGLLKENHRPDIQFAFAAV